MGTGRTGWRPRDISCRVASEGVASGAVTYTANLQSETCEYPRTATSPTFSVLVDATPPQTSISFPPDGGIIKAEDNITGTVTDNYQLGSITGGSYIHSFLGTRPAYDDGGTLYYENEFTDVPWAIPVSAVVPICVDSLQQVTLWVADAVGNFEEVNHSMYVDCQAPLITIDEPTGEGWTDPANPIIRGHATDDIAIDKVWLTIKDDIADRYWDGTEWVAGAALLYIPGVSDKRVTGWEYTGLSKDDLRSGNYTIRAHIKDKVGRLNSVEAGSEYKKRLYLGKKEFIAFDVNVKTVINDGRGTIPDSFTTAILENSIYIEAQITPPSAQTALSGNVRWTVAGMNSQSGTPPKIPGGNPSRFEVPSIPAYPYPNGRRAAMGYRVFARVEQETGNLGSAEKDISQDDIDKCRQEYEDFKVGKYVGKLYFPSRNEFSYSGQSPGGHFTFSNLSGGDYTFAIVKESLYEGLECIREQIQVLDGLGSKELTIVGGYRNPQHNYDIGKDPDQVSGAHDSPHQWGVAADIRWFDINGDGLIDTTDFAKFDDIATEKCGAAWTESYADAKNHYHVNWVR